ncbi:MAG TPA: T9SS type A sorting domain-containing protein [Bacteroidia bacterium]|nr:T9SS type A sorting domain-containing protein [Bacteroidia bacterium]
MKKLLVFLFLAFCLNTKAQLVYVDVNPDSCTCVQGDASLSTNWDLDKDGTTDFTFDVSSMNANGGTNTTGITAATNNFVASYGNVLQLNVGDTINNQTWYAGSFLIESVAMNGMSGYWQLVPDGFIGVKFYSGTTLYYGWIQISIGVSQGDARVLVKDYAYSTSLITANEGSTASIQKNKAQQTVSIYPNPAQNNFTIQTSSNDKQLVNIFDVTGKQVLTQTINGTTSIDASNLSAGVYNISISGNQSVINKKLVIVK